MSVEESESKNMDLPDESKERRGTTMMMIQDDFVPANRKLAIKYLEETSLRGENGKSYRMCRDVKVFGKYSVGLELYMKFLKKLIICMCVMSVLAMIPVVLNILGGYFQNTDRAGTFAQTTLGNQKGIEKDEANQIKAKEAQNQGQVLKYLILFSDLGYCATLTIFLVIFKINMEITIQRHRVQETTPQHYAVQVKGLPRQGINVQDVKRHFSQLFGDVYEVQFAREYGDTLNKFKQRANVIKQIEIQKVRLRIKQIEEKDSIKLQKLGSKLQKIDGKIALKHPDVHSLNDLPVNRAFVVFNQVEDKIRCMNQYNKINRCSLFCYGCCIWKKYKKYFYQGKRLYLTEPDGPSSIKWENLQISKCSRCARYLLILAICLICFLICFVFIYYLRLLQNANVDSDDCNLFNDLDTIDGNTITNPEKLQCFCANLGILEIIRNADLLTGPCKTFILQYIQQQSLIVGLSFIIAFINFFLKKILGLLSTFIRYQSVSSERQTYMISIFIVFFINTGVLILIINGDLSSTFFGEFFTNIPFIGNYIFAGGISDFSRKWYLKVGGSVITILFVNMIIPPVTGLIFYILKKFIRCCCWRKAVIQADLNKIYKGPNYDISNSGATLLANFYIGLMYSGGCPILILVLTVFVFFRYWTDKCLLFKHYCIPPNFDDRFPRKVVSIMPFAIIIHLLFSLWFYTSPDVFPRDITTKKQSANNTATVFVGSVENFQTRVFNEFTTPLLIALAALTFLLGFTSLFFRIFGCCCKDKYQLSKTALQGPYQKQKQNIRGINSYNPIKNDQYRILMVAIDNILKTDKNFSNLDEKLKKVEEEDQGNKQINCLVDQGSFEEQQSKFQNVRAFNNNEQEQQIDKLDNQKLQNIDDGQVQQQQ